MSTPEKVGQTKLMTPHRIQPRREFYPAPNITEQTLRESHLAEVNQVSDDPGFGHGRRHVRRTDDYRIGRKLGLYERLYYKQALKGADVVSLMIKLESTIFITDDSVRYALERLMERHPLMRMSVTKDDKGDYWMYERIGSEYDFRSLTRSDWMRAIKEEFDKPFQEDDKLLWRIRLLNSSKICPSSWKAGINQSASSHMTSLAKSSTASPNTSHSGLIIQSISDQSYPTFQDEFHYDFQATFLFIFNHAITDGGYTMWMFQEFVNFLDAYNLGVDIGQVKKLPLLPPLEKCINVKGQGHEDQSTETRKDFEITDSYLKYQFGQPNADVLNAYQLKFYDEIQTLTSNTEPKNNFVVFQISKPLTRTFLNACKSHNVKANAVVVTASVLALIDLLFETKDTQSEFEVPFEYMSDSRRGNNLEYDGKGVFLYPGLASLNIPLTAHIKLENRPVSLATFWNISKSINKSLQCDITSKQTLKYYSEELDNLEKGVFDCKGKSPFVLCFSNMGRLDGLFNDDVSKRIRMVDLHGQSSILNDDMPIFFVNTFLLNGKLFGSVSYCEGYTSEKTTMKYIGLLQEYLIGYSKL